MSIPLYRSEITKEDIQAVVRVLEEGVLSRGAETDQFEKEFAEYVGKKYAVAVSNGTVALHLLIKTMGWKAGDEVITSPFSFIATVNSLLYEGIKPIFVDIDPLTLNLDPQKVIKRISKKTKGILLPHILGLPCSGQFKKIGLKYNIPIIEDACETIFDKNHNGSVSRIGKASVYSFFCNKPLTTGEGGMIVTDLKRISLYCKSLRDQGRSRKKDWLNHVNLGYNYRITEMQASLGNSQLKRLNLNLLHRQRIAQIYNKNLEGVDGLVLPSLGKEEERCWFIFFVIFKTKADRNRVQGKLGEAGVSSHIYFPSIHLFKHLKATGYKKGDFPISENVSDRILALPLYIGLDEKLVLQIVGIIKANIKR